jgi:hypothetical protein
MFETAVVGGPHLFNRDSCRRRSKVAAPRTLAKIGPCVISHLSSGMRRPAARRMPRAIHLPERDNAKRMAARSLGTSALRIGEPSTQNVRTERPSTSTSQLLSVSIQMVADVRVTSEHRSKNELGRSAHANAKCSRTHVPVGEHRSCVRSLN